MDKANHRNKEKFVFAPGCALMLYKPELASKIHQQLESSLGKMDILNICCQHDPLLPAGSRIINVCPGCDKRFRNDYKNISTISLWEVMEEQSILPLPDYKGQKMTIIDACPTREQDSVHSSIRTLLSKMNISLVEPKQTKRKSTCCGDSFYGEIPTEKVKQLMIKKSSEMPVDDIVVYCVSCVKSVFNGGKNPKYLIDLIYNEETIPKTFDPDEWHEELKEYIEAH